MSSTLSGFPQKLFSSQILTDSANNEEQNKIRRKGARIKPFTRLILESSTVTEGKGLDMKFRIRKRIVVYDTDTEQTE